VFHLKASLPPRDQTQDPSQAWPPIARWWTRRADLDTPVDTWRREKTAVPSNVSPMESSFLMTDFRSSGPRSMCWRSRGAPGDGVPGSNGGRVAVERWKSEGLTRRFGGRRTPKKHLGAMPPMGGSPLSAADLKVSAYGWSIGHRIELEMVKK